jgi:hypothetical protein
MGTASKLHTFILEDFWTKIGLKVLFRVPSISASFAAFVKYLFHFNKKFLNHDS